MTDRPFYGAECPSYPDCEGGCGLGCTKKIENARAAMLQPASVGHDTWVKILADNWRGRNGNSTTGDSVRNSCADELEKVAARNGFGAVAQAGTERPVEVWNGDRKVSVYDDIVVRLDGPNNGSIGMSEQPRSHESVGEAFKWLFEAAKSSREARYRVALEKIAGRVPKQKHPAFLRIVCPVCQWKSVEPHTEARHAPNCAAEVARAALALPSTHQPCPECEANGLCARHASTERVGK